VIGFRSSSGLASAYGIAVTLTMLTTTSLFYFACRRLWTWTAWKALIVCGIFALIETAFFASNALKVFHGGWLPLCIGALLFYLMTTWKLGRSVIREQQESAVPLQDFITSLANDHDKAHETLRVKGTGVFLTSSEHVTPGALVQNLKHNHVIHGRTVVLTIVTDNVPRRNRNSRLEIISLPMQFFQIIAHFGFMEYPTLSEIIDCAAAHEFSIDIETTSFILGGQTLVPTKDKGLPAWREAAFRYMSNNAQRASEALKMPCGRTIEILWQVEI
jgi:KUP system potassium uptake protein